MFDLGDYGLGAAQFLDMQTKRLHIGSTAHKTLGEEIHAFLHAPADVFQILRSQGIEGNIQSDGMDALACLQQASHQHLQKDLLIVYFRDLKFQRTVVAGVPAA